MSTPPPRKKLIEAALPLEAINHESAREKSIGHGQPSRRGGAARLFPATFRIRKGAVPL
jgi:hypothetical protein